MSDLRQAAQKVVDAWDTHENGTMDHPLSGVMEVLRDALAQPEPRREWQRLTDEEIIDAREQIHAEDLCNWSFSQGVIFAEQALKERNHE